MTKPHLLYVAFSFPPSTASSVYRCTAVANAFVARGWDVTVLTVDPQVWSEISGTDRGLVESIDPRIRIVAVDDGGAEEPARRDLRRFSRLRVEAPYLWKELFRRKTRKDFPEDFHGAWLAPAAAAAKSIQSEHPVDLVMASASPYVSFAVARSLPGVPYVLDYRDAWAFNTISGVEDFSPESEMGKLEADYLANAAQVWFVNDQISAEYAKRYPFAKQKMRVVANGFDPQPGHRPPNPSGETHPRFGYLGTLQYVNMPLQEFIDGWKIAFDTAEQESAEAIFRGKLSASGAAPAEVLEAFSDDLKSALKYQGPISKRDVASFYQSLDALILLLSSGKFVTGGKTAEYLATGLPIVSVHDLDNAATDILRDYPLWFPARDLTPQAIAEALQAAAAEIRNPELEKWARAWEYGQGFSRDSILEPIISELRSSIEVAGIPNTKDQGND